MFVKDAVWKELQFVPTTAMVTEMTAYLFILEDVFYLYNVSLFSSEQQIFRRSLSECFTRRWFCVFECIIVGEGEVDGLVVGCCQKGGMKRRI